MSEKDRPIERIGDAQRVHGTRPIRQQDLRDPGQIFERMSGTDDVRFSSLALRRGDSGCCCGGPRFQPMYGIFPEPTPKPEPQPMYGIFPKPDPSPQPMYGIFPDPWPPKPDPSPQPMYGIFPDPWPPKP
ncbi:MAG: hypothetical protein HYU64_01760, partial [Armatimonadetes bacterium]|nr:hypothetical protein [Armatimonadota bacterium]